MGIEQEPWRKLPLLCVVSQDSMVAYMKHFSLALTLVKDFAKWHNMHQLQAVL